jgi:hypothetical protein
MNNYFNTFYIPSKNEALNFLDNPVVTIDSYTGTQAEYIVTVTFDDERYVFIKSVERQFAEYLLRNGRFENFVEEFKDYCRDCIVKEIEKDLNSKICCSKKMEIE